MPEINKDRKGDLFTDVQLIRRGKDFPNLPSANYEFKTIYIDSINQLERYEDEMRKCCDIFGLRAYISVCLKSKRKFLSNIIGKYADSLIEEDYKRPWRVVQSACGSMTPTYKAWIVDVDEGIDIDAVKTSIGKSSSTFENVIIMEVPTRNGIHLITHPFNVAEFKSFMGSKEKPEIKRNHLSLLYENL